MPPWYAHRASIAGVTVESGVTGLDAYAFRGCGAMAHYGYYNADSAPWHSYKSNIQRVVISRGVTTIGNYAFSGCSALSDIEIPEGLTSVGSYSFNYCTGLTNIVFSEGLTRIAGSAFSNCSELTSITFPLSLSQIGSYALPGYRLTGLTDVYYAGSADEWLSVGIDSGNDSLDKAVMHYAKEGNTITAVARGVCRIKRIFRHR